jgi:hypothetical protein
MSLYLGDKLIAGAEQKTDVVNVTDDQDIGGNKNFTGTLTWNGKEHSSWGMPSNRYDNLTLGASDTNYTAPANGWFSASGSGNTAGQFVYFATANNGAMRNRIVVAANGYINGSIPCKKGDYVRVQYNTTNKPSLFFIYAEGEN